MNLLIMILGFCDFTILSFHLTEWCCVKSTQINGTVGHPLIFQCLYPPQHRDNRKFLCKGDHRNKCTDMVTSQSRFAIEDNGSSTRIFTTTIFDLRSVDAGKYWCGVSKFGKDIYTESKSKSTLFVNSATCTGHTENRNFVTLKP
uniref:Immunoglobulin V-set domain-containing protein n=1 Tax=Maylandia zebra TaxID=106582 RepID=A0A3P9BG19_9CICH